MYKVMFVDDEEQNLFLMEKIIDWEEVGFRVCGMALDGREGIEMYREASPELMFVDIRMEEMDGLTLIQKLKEEYGAQDTLFVIVTAYDEFSYAQKAIRLGVNNYLLKPLDRKELREMAKELCGKIHRKKEEQKKKELIDKQREAYYFDRAFRKINEMLLKKETLSGVELGLDPVIGGRRLLLIMLFSVNCSMAQLSEAAQHWPVLCSFAEGDSLYFIVEEENTRKIIEEYKEIALRPSRLKYIMQISRPFWDEASFIESSEEAFHTRNAMFYEKTSQYFFSESVKREQLFGDSQQLESDAETLFHKLIYSGDARETNRKIEEMLKKAEADRTDPGQVIDRMTDLVFQLKIQLTRIYKEKAFALLRHQNLWEFHRFHTSERLKEELVCMFNETGRAVADILENKENYSILGKITEYIKQRYTDSDFSAQDAADEVNLSRNYFLRIFKEEYGMSFLDYVTKLRMERAKELLKNSNLTIYAISREIGYESQYHFSRKFKAMFGITPIEYRNL